MVDSPEMPTADEILRHCASDSATGAIVGVGAIAAEEGYAALFTTMQLCLTLLERTKGGKPYAAVVDLIAKQLQEAGPDTDAMQHYRESWHDRTADEDQYSAMDEFGTHMLQGASRAAVAGLRMTLGPLPAPLYAMTLAVVVTSVAASLTQRGSDGERIIPTVIGLLQRQLAPNTSRTLN